MKTKHIFHNHNFIIFNITGSLQEENTDANLYSFLIAFNYSDLAKKKSSEYCQETLIYFLFQQRQNKLQVLLK